MNCNQGAEAATIRFSKSDVQLQIGKKEQLKLKHTKKKITWSTANKKIATVSDTGVVTAKQAGQVLITATVGKKQYHCPVYIKGPELSYTDIVSFVGGTKRLGISNAEGNHAKWTSSDPKVVKIDYVSNTVGQACYADLVMLKEGSVKLTAKINGVTLSCNIKVIKKNKDITKSNQKIYKLSKKYNLYVESKNQIEFAPTYTGAWIAMYDDYIAFVIPRTGTGEENFVEYMKEFIPIVLPKKGKQVCEYFFEDFLTTRSMILEDKVVQLTEEGMYRFLVITNKDYN